MDQIFELIEQYDCITLYRHISPDADALGSQFGLKQWISETYPSKKVYALGYEAGSKQLFPDSDIVDDEIISNSLAVILDTANASRIDDERWSLAKCSVKIDHHIFVEQYAQVEYIEDLAGATCEILASLFELKKIQLSAKAAQYLYGGMIADTLRFSIPTTTPRTLLLASYLVGCGVDVQKANEDNFSTSLKQYRYENYLRSNCLIRDEKMAYIIINKDDYESFGLSFHEAKEKVFVFGGVHEFEAWALFVEKEKDELGNRRFNGSLRSRKTVINEIASHYQGGGHRYACGVKNLTLDDIDKIVNEILAAVTQKQ